MYTRAQGIDYYSVKAICKIKIQTELQALMKEKGTHFSPVKTLLNMSGN